MARPDVETEGSMARRLSVILAALLVAPALTFGIVAPEASAATPVVKALVPPCSIDPELCETLGTHPTEIQVWTVNLNDLNRSWGGFVARMQANDFPPDIILAQELNSTLATTFLARVRLTLGTQYQAESGSGATTVIWNRDRFSRLGGTAWSTSCRGTSSGTAVNLRDKDASSVFLETRNVVAASMHAHTGDRQRCMNQAWAGANSAIDGLAGTRRMTILAGDFNGRPEKRDPYLRNGLETDPSCWYRLASAGHLNTGVPSLDACGTASHDRYYDTVWLYPGAGGGTNPGAPAICEQYTYSYRVDPLNGEAGDAAGNSCTPELPNVDLVPPLEPDKGRIDYIWVSYESADGRAWIPPAPVVAGHIAYASADLGQSLDPGTLGTSYSDHRAVQALLTWPAAMLNP